MHVHGLNVADHSLAPKVFFYMQTKVQNEVTGFNAKLSVRYL